MTDIAHFISRTYLVQFGLVVCKREFPICILKNWRGEVKGYPNKFCTRGSFPDRTRVVVPPVIGLTFVITNESGSLPISRTCHIYICTFLPSRSRSYFSVKFKPWDDVSVQNTSHTHIWAINHQGRLSEGNNPGLTAMEKCLATH